MRKAKRKCLELVEKLIRKQSGMDNNMDDPPGCVMWFYQPRRPEKITENKR